MSDHISGPRAIADPVIDITDVYAFPCPESQRHLIVIMNVFPYAGPTARYSDAVIYRLRLRSASIAPDGRTFAIASDESTFDFTFSGAEVQKCHCALPTGDVITFHVNDESGGTGNGVQIFAGQRSDPFFLDGPMIERTIVTRQFAFKEVGSDRLYGKNVLGLVLKIEWPTVLKGGPMFAIVGETLSAGKKPVRLERVGRPEIKNVSLSPKMFDTVNRDFEVRDIYNEEDAFNVSKTYMGAYRARLNANLAFWDSLDGKVDWPFDQHGNHPLTELLLADFLIVDASKPFSEKSFFEIEQAMLEGRSHASCGGRWLNEDLIDFLLTLYVNAGKGPRIRDGVDAPIAWSTQTFPYMAPPNRPEVVAS